MATTALNKEALRAFEREIAEAFEAKKIHAPVHLSGGNEEELIRIFERINPWDWVFSTWRSHYHALLHGIPAQWVAAQIRDGHSMTLSNVGHKFFASAIVAGCLPIAVGVAAAIKRKDEGLCWPEKVWCFVGDMAARTGAFHEAVGYAMGHALPIEFVVENNGFSTDTPTEKAWGEGSVVSVTRYKYQRIWPHVNSGKWVNF